MSCVWFFFNFYSKVATPRNGTASAGEEEPLLQNEVNPPRTHYGGENGQNKQKAEVKPARRTQVSGTGWLEYIAGFRTLFPYLWYCHLKNRMLSTLH